MRDLGGHILAENVLDNTLSLCPECLKLLPATIFEEGNKVWIRKICPEHGKFRELYWGDYFMYNKASKFAIKGKGIENPLVDKENPECPKDCGLCRLHESHTALTNLVVTNRCDLNCWYCFFFAEKAGYVYEPTIKEMVEMLKPIRAERPIKGNAVQLTGGEPLMREDLVELVKEIKKLGFDHVQLNTDGIRLSQNLELAKKLRETGINTLYLSFDGVDEKTNPKNHWEIPNAIKTCREADIGIVLVPTVINSINDHQLGDILRFGFENIDIVRGINFQPVSLVGRVPKQERERFRITIPDVIKKLEEQTNGELCRGDFYPVPCITPFSLFVEVLTGKPQYDLPTHFACGMATYLFKEGDKMLPITRFVDFDGLYEYMRGRIDDLQSGRKNKYLVTAELLMKIGSFIDMKKQPRDLNLAKILYDVIVRHDYEALRDFHHKSMFVGMMHFQDLYNWDIKRVKKCSIHYATPEGIIPFCTFNVIPEWYRDKIQRKHSMSIEEWENKTGRKLEDDLYRRNLPNE